MKMYPSALIAAGGAATLLIAYPLVSWWQVKRLEKPKYVVVRTIGKAKSWITGKPIAEIRKYAPFLIAEVAVQEFEMKAALRAGFMQVARYIFGGNTAPAGAQASEAIAMTSPVRLDKEPKSESIAMTSPVAAQPTTDGAWRVSFMMPSKYTLETIPKPNNPNVELKVVPERTVAAISFTGNLPSQATMDSWRDKLLDILKEEDIEVEGEPMLYQYHPPFAPSFIRVNEVLYNVKEA